MTKQPVMVRHVYDKDGGQFEADVNEALRRILEEGAMIEEIKYVSDPQGYGALIIYGFESED